MIRSYTWNGRDVTEAEFAQRVSDLMRAGWAFQNPAATRDALLAKFEALADRWADDTGIEGYINLGEAEDALRAAITEARS